MNINNYMTVKEAAHRWGVKVPALREKLNLQRRPELQKEIDCGLVKYFKADGAAYGDWIISKKAMEKWYGEEVNKPIAKEAVKEDGLLKEFPRNEKNLLDIDKLIGITSEQFYKMLLEDNGNDKSEFDKYFRVYYMVDAFGTLTIWTRNRYAIVLKKYEFYPETNECRRVNAVSGLDAAVYSKVFNDKDAEDIIRIYTEKL